MYSIKTKKTFIITFFILFTIFSSCAMNRTIILTPISPSSFYENNIFVGVSEHQDNWIYVDPETNLFSFTLHIRVNSIPEDICISSIQLEVVSLNIKTKEFEINKYATDKYIESINNPYKYFNTININNLFSINDILDTYNLNNRKKINKLSLYELFKKNTELTLNIMYHYTINGKKYYSKILLRYKTNKDKSPRFWDTWMSA